MSDESKDVAAMDTGNGGGGGGADGDGVDNDVTMEDVDGGPVTASGDAAAASSSSSPDDGDDPASEARRLVEMLRSDDAAHRVTAAGRLDAIAAGLGPRRTREELLPFLTESVDDEDEVLAATAASVRDLIPRVGGPEHLRALLPPLEDLLSVEEVAVRDRAAVSATAVAEGMPDGSFQRDYGDALSRLATREWFTARMSACRLLAESLRRFSKDRQIKHVNYFAALCRDEVPMVRRVASQYLGTLFQNFVESQAERQRYASGAAPTSRSKIDDELVLTVLLPLYEELAVNDQDSVRLQTTENCVAFGRAVSSTFASSSSDAATADDVDEDDEDDVTRELVQRILPLIVATIDDRSWRVRWTAASKFADVVKAFVRIPRALDALVPAYEKLLQDPEAEVRTAATYNLAEVARCNTTIRDVEDGGGGGGDGDGGGEDGGGEGNSNGDKNNTTNNDNDEVPTVSVAERLVRRITVLTEDESEHVRAALATVATHLAPVLGKESTISHLVPPVLLLLRDAAPEVRLNLISNLSGLNEVVGVDLLSQSLLPAILDLAEDGKWRVRSAIIGHVPLLAGQLGEEFFTEQLVDLCVGWLGDDIDSIRRAAAANLRELAALFGAEWAVARLLPAVAEIGRHPSYLRRLTAVRACALMSEVVDAEVVRTEFLPLVLDMAKDEVPNIRFNVAKGLQTMAPICGSATCESQIRPILLVMMEDRDRDVKYFASQSLATLDSLLENSTTTNDEGGDAPLSKI